MSESHALVRQLLQEMATTVERLSVLADADVPRPVSHGCAMDGGLRRLLVHNAEHDRQHAGQISGARQAVRSMPESELAWLLREWLRARVDLVGLLLGAPDAVLEAKAPKDEWTVRQHVEHILHWERDSRESALRDLLPQVAGSR